MNDENTALQPENAGSQRSVSLLSDMDPAQTKADLRLIRKAQREGWKISPKVKRIIARRLVGIVQKTEVEVCTKDGMAHVDGPADTNAIAAARVLVAMNGQDQADDHKATPDKVLHAHEHHVTHVTAIVERRNQLAGILSSLRDRAGVGTDSVANSGSE